VKILYITRKFPPSIGGMQTQSYEFYNALRRQNEIYLIAWGHSQKLLPFFLLVALIKGVYYSFRYGIRVVQLGDLVLSPLGLVFKYVLGEKVLAMSHGKDAAYGNAFYRFVVFNSARKLDGIVCVSGFLRQRLMDNGFDGGKLFVNPNGIEFGKYEERFDKKASLARVKEAFGIDLAGRKVILAVSRLVRKKGLAYFSENIFPKVVKERPEAVLLLVGDAESREAAREKAKISEYAKNSDIEKNVLFLGNVSDREGLLRCLYSVADVYIMPNRSMKGDYEGFGLVALEAGANGVPVVAFNVDGIPEAVKDGENGFLVEENDDGKFAAEVIKLISDDVAGAQAGGKAREFVRNNYDWSVIVERYDGILKTVTGR
jgi:phosphatidylinositol alpha-1,6-mannosyltransferase